METKNQKLIIAVDAILEYLTNVWNGDIHITDINQIQSDLYKQHKFITASFFSDVIQILIEEDYVMDIGDTDDEDDDDDDDNDADDDSDDDEYPLTDIVITTKGHLLYLNGGLLEKYKAERNRNRLYVWGQWAVVAAGLYSVIALINELNEMFHWY